MNPCLCGFYTDPEKERTCFILMIKSNPQAKEYPARSTFGRIDIHVEVPRIPLVEVAEKCLEAPR